MFLCFDCFLVSSQACSVGVALAFLVNQRRTAAAFIASNLSHISSASDALIILKNGATG
jgi:hypothetical protein